MPFSYGTGTAIQFSDATQRQVLELGKKIHYYNPSVTPILTIGGRASTRVSPVPIFEWMEDEYFMKRSIKTKIVTEGADSATVDVSDRKTTDEAQTHNCVLRLERQAMVELFEVGGIYSASFSGGSAAPGADVTHLICVAVGKDCDLTSPTDRHVQFIGAHAHATIAAAYNVEVMTDTTDLIVVDAVGVLTLEYVANAGLFYDAGTATSYYGHNIGGFGLDNLADADYFASNSGPGQGYAEGAAVGVETRKKVRRLKNCTQIFREPYTITGTAIAAKHYGGSELSRLQARKLAKLKIDMEWALLTNGAISLDSTSENPQRTFQGFGVGGSAGIVQSNNADLAPAAAAAGSLTWDISSGTLKQFDAMIETIFSDMVAGSMKKTVFASNKWLKEVTSMVRSGTNSQVEVEMGSDATGGLRIRRYYGPVGELEFIAHPMLNGSYENYALAVDFANFDWRPLAGRDVQLRRDIVQDGSDGITDEWLVEAGPEIRNEQSHAILKLQA